MKLYVWLSFAVMGWGYYEMSGGSDFVPQQREIAQAPVQAPEIVTRAASPTLLAVSTSNVVAQPEVQGEDVAQAAATPDAPETDQLVEVAAPVVGPKLDLREILGTRVNMRMGPGTGFDVITTLDGGTKLEVLSVDNQGWANVSTELGLEGWMAERLLSDPET